MKQFLQMAVVLTVALILSEIFVFYYNKPLREAQILDHKNAIETLPPTIREQRLALEKKQSEELRSYRRIKKRSGYVQIPIDRAFDYYLNNPRRP